MNDDVAARKTYRYARLGLLGAVLLIGVSVGIERSKIDCWQTSISAYYYTPVRAVLVGALIAIGLTLIVLKGSTWQEDLCLNAAGMLAPIVALVPTSGAGECYSIPPEAFPTYKDANGNKVFEDWVLANINNNVPTLLIAGAIGLGVASVIAIAAMGIGKSRNELEGGVLKRNWPTLVALGLTGAAIAAAAIWRAGWPDYFNERSHGFAAVAMFGCLALAALANAFDCKDHGRSTYAWIYLLIALAMGATGALFLIPDDDWKHKVLVIEILEISLFALLWAVQSRELWHDTLRHSDHAPVPLITGPDGGPIQFSMLSFDKRGASIAPDTQAETVAELATFEATDVFLFSHGWNTDSETATRKYEEFILGYQDFRSANDLGSPEGYKPVLIGIHWPSASFVFDYEGPPDMAADGPTPLTRADMEALAVFDDELATVDAEALRSLAEADGTPDAQLAALLAPLLHEPDEVGAPAVTADQLLALWGPDGGRDFDGRGEFGAIRQPAGGVAPAGIFAKARDVIRQATVWLMKDRAGRVGARGVATLLHDLQVAAPNARFHLIGHSYGCKLLLSALTAKVPARPVDSLLLLQAAVNGRCFAPNRGDGSPGGYRPALARVQQPILVTFSDKDTSLRKLFHWIMRRPDDLGEIAIAGGDDEEVPPSPYCALGGWGPMNTTNDTTWTDMKHEPDLYDLAGAKDILAVRANSDITSHGDIANAGSYWALYSLVRAASSIPAAQP